MLPQHSRTHRRQASTPSAYAGVKKPSVPIAARPSGAHHRRGLSHDVRARQEQMHYVLRETQQQRTKARPGIGTHSRRQNGSVDIIDFEEYMTPNGTPQAGFVHSPNLTIQTGFPTLSFDTVMPSGQMHHNADFELFSGRSAHSTPTFPTFAEEQSFGHDWISDEEVAGKTSRRRVSNGIRDRVSRFENLSVKDEDLPTTPPSYQNVNTYFPPTPMETPQERQEKQTIRQRHITDAAMESWMDETIKPTRGRPGSGAQNTFQMLRQQADQMERAGPSPPGSDNLLDDTSAPTNFTQAELMSFSEVTVQDTFQFPSHQISPVALNMGMSGTNAYAACLDLTPSAHVMEASLSQHSSASMTSAASPRRHNHHRRAESLASAASQSVASIADIDIEETKTMTGITLDDIAVYIRGPETSDNKWVCIFDDCGKRFGRKENIKSHVQTHLNDRQFQCPSCHKCFVRQHDLKRHAKIHTGVKPYPCECGNSFARHDALTRHKQRGMCVGAFDGAVRKSAKRGRPKKESRPTMEGRIEKSTRTRTKNMSVSSMSSAFSAYSSSESSGAASPEDYDKLELMLKMDVDAPSQVYTMSASSSAPMPNIAPSANMRSSPVVATPHSFVSPEEILEQSFPSSPMMSPESQHQMLPELSHFASNGLESTAGSSMASELPSDPCGPSDALFYQFSSDGLGSMDPIHSDAVLVEDFEKEFMNF